MNRYKLHEDKAPEPTETYDCNWDFEVQHLRRGDFLSVEWDKVSCGIPNGYQCYILKVNENTIDVLMEDQPASSTGWCYDSIPKENFKQKFWATHIHRRNVDIEALIKLFAEQETIIHPHPMPAKSIFGFPINGGA